MSRAVGALHRQCKGLMRIQVIQLYDMVAQRVECCLYTILKAQLLEDIRHVRLDSFKPDAEMIGDFLIVQPASD